MNIEEFLTLAAEKEASDLFIIAGLPLTMKTNGVMHRINEERMMPQDTEEMIRENKVHQIDGLIYSSTGSGMMSMDQSLMQAYRDGKITKETAVLYALNAEMLSKRLR